MPVHAGDMHLHLRPQAWASHLDAAKVLPQVQLRGLPVGFAVLPLQGPYKRLNQP